MGLETNDPLPEFLHCTSAWSPASNICQTSDVEGCAVSGTAGLRLTPFEANSAAQLENHFYPSHGRTHRICFGARAAVCLVALRRCSVIRKHRVIGRVPASRCPPGARVRHGVRAKSDGHPRTLDTAPLKRIGSWVAAVAATVVVAAMFRPS